MEELMIHKYQAESIENALRLAARALKSKDCETCMDRDVMQAWDMITNILNKEPEKLSTKARFKQ